MNRTTTVQGTIDGRSLAIFLVVLSGLVAGFVAVTHLVGVDLVAVGPLYMFTPAIAGLVVCLHRGIPVSTVGLRLGRKRWLAVAAVLPLPVIGAVTLLSLGVPGVAFDSSVDLPAQVGLPSGPLWTLVAIVAIVLIGATVNALVAFGEEFGWRGYLLWELAPLGFWKASVAIGAVWGLWHAPVVLAGHNYPSFPFVGVVAFTITCIAMAPLFTYLVVRSESVLPAAIFHGVFNAAGFVAYAGTGDPLLRELVASEGGVVGVTVLAAIALLIAISGTPRLTRAFATTGVTASRDAEPTAPNSATSVPSSTER